MKTHERLQEAAKTVATALGGIIGVILLILVAVIVIGLLVKTAVGIWSSIF